MLRKSGVSLINNFSTSQEYTFEFHLKVVEDQTQHTGFDHSILWIFQFILKYFTKFFQFRLYHIFTILLVRVFIVKILMIVFSFVKNGVRLHNGYNIVFIGFGIV